LFLIAKVKEKSTLPALHLLINSQLVNLSKMNRYRPGVSFPYNPLSGTLYIASQTVESNIFEAFVNKVNKLLKAFYFVRSHNLISIGSTKQNNINNNSIDYIFTDPPFGSNIYVFGAEFSLGKLAKSKNQ
jgi:hypothetical protein